jgi:hypothetical protein
MRVIVREQVGRLDLKGKVEQLTSELAREKAERHVDLACITSLQSNVMSLSNPAVVVPVVEQVVSKIDERNNNKKRKSPDSSVGKSQKEKRARRKEVISFSREMMELVEKLVKVEDRTSSGGERVIIDTLINKYVGCYGRNGEQCVGVKKDMSTSSGQLAGQMELDETKAKMITGETLEPTFKVSGK